jgi:transposase
VDETGIDTFIYREYGRSKRGEPVIGSISGRKFKRVGIVAAQMGKAILAPLSYDGVMDSKLFETWFEKCLLTVLPEESVIVMDNASFHRKGRLSCIAEKSGHQLIFLPPYSPELNPIENFWSWLKGYLRNVIPCHNKFDDALCSAFQPR